MDLAEVTVVSAKNADGSPRDMDGKVDVLGETIYEDQHSPDVTGTNSPIDPTGGLSSGAGSSNPHNPAYGPTGEPTESSGALDPRGTGGNWGYNSGGSNSQPGDVHDPTDTPGYGSQTEPSSPEPTSSGGTTSPASGNSGPGAGGGNHGTPTSGSGGDPTTHGFEPNDPRSQGFPIVVDLDGDGVEITFGEAIYFDWDDDGYREQGSWVSADDGFLVLDLNADGTRGVGDGEIDQTRELVMSLWGDAGDTDLQALRRAFDENNDGLLNDQDAVWSELRIWQDLNQNGESDNDELKTLAEWGITQINLGYDDGTDYGDTDDDITVFGNTLHGLASFLHDGSQITPPEGAVATGGVYTVTGGVGDVSLSYNTLGWRRVYTEGDDVPEDERDYRIEFENGASFQYAVLGASDASSVNLVTRWLDGATGDDRANSLNATGHMLAVQIAGGAGDDVITGGQLDDMLSGDDGADELRGGAGNDVIFFDADDTVVLGGADLDTAVFVGDSGIEFDLIAHEFEAFYGGDGDDTIYATSAVEAVAVYGGAGDDSVRTGDGSDVLSGDD